MFKPPMHCYASPRSIRIVSFAIAMITLSGEFALGQIHFTGDPVFLPNYPQDFPPYSVDPAISNLVATPTTDGFTVKGDVTTRYDRSAVSPPTGIQSLYQFVVERPFTVGPLPVNVHGGLVENLEAVIGNGSATAPEMNFRTYLSFFVWDGGYPIITSLFTWGIGNPYDATLTGNGSEVFNTDASTGNFILGPGFDYSVQYRLEAWIDNSLLTDRDPPPTITFELGGVSDFEGAQASVIGVLLPEPSSFVLAGMGAGLVAAISWNRRLKQRQRNRSAKQHQYCPSQKGLQLVFRSIVVTIASILSASEIAQAAMVDLYAGQTVQIAFTVSNKLAATPDTFYLAFGPSPVVVEEAFGSRTARLFNGATLIGQDVDSSFGAHIGPLSLHPSNTWKSPTSLWAGGTVVDFGTLFEGTQSGLIEFQIATGHCSIPTGRNPTGTSAGQ